MFRSAGRRGGEGRRETCRSIAPGLDGADRRRDGGLGRPATAEAPPEYFVDETKLPFAAIPGIDTDRYWGIHNGAGYRIEVPRNWNHRLVMRAHGFRGSRLELTVDNHPLRAFLAANGYAWAASSFSRNEYDVEAGVKDTHALTQRLNGIVGKPDLTYLTGASMGGHVTAAAIEQYPQATTGQCRSAACSVTTSCSTFPRLQPRRRRARRRRPAELPA